MRATSLPVFAAFLALAGFDFIPCQTAAEAARPRYYFPQAVKREVTNGWNDLKRANEEAELAERSPADGDVVVIPITVIVDADGNKKTITGVPGGKPTDPPKPEINPAPLPVKPVKKPVQNVPVDNTPIKNKPVNNNTPGQNGGNTPSSNPPGNQPSGNNPQNSQPQQPTSKKPTTSPKKPTNNPIDSLTNNLTKNPTKNPVNPGPTSPKAPVLTNPNPAPSTSKKLTSSKPNNPDPSKPNNPQSPPTDDPIIDIPGIVDGILPGSSTPVGSSTPTPLLPTDNQEPTGTTVGLSGIVNPQPTSSNTEDEGLLPSIIDILPTKSDDGIFPTLIPTPGDGTTTYPGGTGGVSPTTTPATTTSDGWDITDILPPWDDEPTTTTTGSETAPTYPSNGTETDTPSPTTTDDGIDLPLPTITDLLPTLPTLTLPIPSLPTGPLIPPIGSSSEPSGSSSVPSPSEPTESGSPTDPTTTATPTDEPTATPPGSEPSSGPSYSSSVPTVSSPPTPTTTTTSENSEPTTTKEAPTTTTTKEPVPVPQPTDDDSESTQYVEPSIIFQPTDQPDTTAPAPTTTDDAAVPTQTPDLPQVISPNTGTPAQPPNTTLVQLGFNGQLSYEWVMANTMSISQIFLYVPQGISYGLEIPLDQVVMESIRPYNLGSGAPYTTTLVLQYIPEDMVTLLGAQLHNRNSLLYNHPDQSVNTVMSMLDPTIPLDAGQGLGVAPDGDGSGDSNQNNHNENSGPGGSGDGGAVRPSSIGIGVGVVCGAAAYGAAMFFVARRYRNKRKEHRRSSSVSEGEYQDSPHESPMMSGARDDGFGSTTPYAGGRYSQTSGGSARTQMISAPVMAENSLGWN